MSIKVLVVDPSKKAEQLCKDTLLPLGCQIITASSTALGVFLARKNFPSLIINGIDAKTDVDLPQEIKSDPDLSHIPVVLVSVDTAAGEPPKAKLSGAAKILAQPLTPERLFEELRPYLIDSEDDRPEETSE